MVFDMLPLAAVLAVGIPTFEEAALHTHDPKSVASNSDRQVTDTTMQAAQGPIPAPVSVAVNPLPSSAIGSPAEARGRRTLSTAFVRIGPDGNLTVERDDGRVLVLRDVVMRAKDYCGLLVSGGLAGKRYCGRYGQIVAARPGGGLPHESTIPAEAGPAPR